MFNGFYTVDKQIMREEMSMNKKLVQTLTENFNVEVEDEGSEEEPWYRFEIDDMPFQGGVLNDALFLSLGVAKIDLDSDFDSIYQKLETLSQSIHPAIRYVEADNYFNVELVPDKTDFDQEQIKFRLELLIEAAKKTDFLEFVEEFHNYYL